MKLTTSFAHQDRSFIVSPHSLQETGGHNNVLVVAFYTREGGGYVSSNISKALPQTYAIVYNVFVVVFFWQWKSQWTWLGTSRGVSLRTVFLVGSTCPCLSRREYTWNSVDSCRRKGCFSMTRMRHGLPSRILWALPVFRTEKTIIIIVLKKLKKLKIGRLIPPLTCAAVSIRHFFSAIE
jgi:hypothetical protein